MARSRETKIELTAYDDLFQTDESREEEKLSKIRGIPISEIDEFPDHPFKVLMDEDMEQLVESIKRSIFFYLPTLWASAFISLHAGITAGVRNTALRNGAMQVL